MDGRSLARRLLCVVACLMGAAGVAAAAAAAHVAGERLAPASVLLMVHGAAVLALGSTVGKTLPGLLAMAGLAAGSLLFAGDMAMRTWAGSALFPMAAPIGGTTAILAWLVAAIAVSRMR